MKRLSIFCLLFVFSSCSLLVSFDEKKENCSNGKDDTGNGLVDCEDPDCANSPDCATVNNWNQINNWNSVNNINNTNNGDREICDNGVDDNANGLVDCEDPFCEDFWICEMGLAKCDQTVFIQFEPFSATYWTSIFKNGTEENGCPTNRFCQIYTQHSMVPHCYPVPGTVAQPYRSCMSNHCPPGHMCLSSPTMSGGSDRICLPYCAPGHVSACAPDGNIRTLCFRQESVHEYDLLRTNVETWVCDQPRCDAILNTGCQSGHICFAKHDLMGQAECLNPGNQIPPMVGAGCENDIDCPARTICHPEMKTCTELCIPGNEGVCALSLTRGLSVNCVKHPMQNFGVCIRQ